MGLTSDTMTMMINNYKVQTYFIFEFINLVIFVLFSLYLDQVFPNEFGQKKHPLFFLKWLQPKKKPQKAHSLNHPLIGDDDMEIDESDIEVNFLLLIFIVFFHELH